MSFYVDMICSLHAVQCGSAMSVICRIYVDVMCLLKPFYVELICPIHTVLCSVMSGHSTWMCYVRYMPFYVVVLCTLQAILRGCVMSVTCRSMWMCYVRYRPFYVEVASPQPKDLVVVIDTSGSMRTTHKGRSLMQIAIEAATTVVDTLGPNDRVRASCGVEVRHAIAMILFC